jgi:hypothetical protein
LRRRRLRDKKCFYTKSLFWVFCPCCALAHLKDSTIRGSLCVSILILRNSNGRLCLLNLIISDETKTSKLHTHVGYPHPSYAASERKVRVSAHSNSFATTIKISLRRKQNYFIGVHLMEELSAGSKKCLVSFVHRLFIARASRSQRRTAIHSQMSKQPFAPYAPDDADGSQYQITFHCRPIFTHHPGFPRASSRAPRSARRAPRRLAFNLIIRSRPFCSRTRARARGITAGRFHCFRRAADDTGCCIRSHFRY